MESTKKKKPVCALRGAKSHRSVARDEDHVAVRALPITWIPCHGGPILANYLKQREQNHQTILQSLSEDAGMLNAEIDVEIRALAEDIRSHIQHNQTEINCIVECCNASSNQFTPEIRNEALNNINQLTVQRFGEVSKFKCEALALERKRGNRLRELLRDCFQKLLAVGNETSTHMLHCFDERVYEINQQLLSNRRAYAELESRLRAQADTDMVRAKSSLNQLYLGIPLHFHKRISQQPISTIFIRDSYSASDSGGRDSWVRSIKHILDGVEEFDQCVGLIVDTYKNALLNIFNDFSGKFIHIREGLGRRDREEFSTDVFETSELRLVVEEKLRRLSRLSNSMNSKENSTKSEIESTYRDALNLQKTLGNLGCNLRKTFDILNDAGHLWDAHIMRSAFAQKLMMAAVEDLLTNNDSLELINEVSFSVALEQMRTSENTIKLEHCFSGLADLLNKTAESYLSHSEEEIWCLEEFMNLPMAKTLLAEIDCFLERHPRGNPDATIGSNSISIPTGTLTPQRDSVCFTTLNRVILQSELRSMALQNWKNGFLESFQSNVSLVPDELDRQARSWVHERKALLNVRYSMKMMSHSIRLERVKAAKEMRLAELNHHDTRLASHLAAIFELIDSFTTETPNLLSIDEPSLYPFCDWMDMIKVSLDELERDQLDSKTKRLKKSSYPPRLMKHRMLFEESLDEALDVYRRCVDQRLQAARIANFRFISALKLFGEGGNYSCHEASKTAATLVRAADALEACVYKTYDGVIQRRTELLKKADGLMEPLMRLSRGLPETVTMKGQELTKQSKKSLVKRRDLNF